MEGLVLVQGAYSKFLTTQFWYRIITIGQLTLEIDLEKVALLYGQHWLKNGAHIV